jgi:hypothetical protein
VRLGQSPGEENAEGNGEGEMKYVLVVISCGDGEEHGARIQSVRFKTYEAAKSAADWLNKNPYRTWTHIVEDGE